jgi:hypothetical protein
MYDRAVKMPERWARNGEIWFPGICASVDNTGRMEEVLADQ